MKAKTEADPVMRKARKLFEQSGKSLDELGLAMESEGDTARKYAWQYLNKVNDPRISTLRRFAKAMGVTLKDLL